jgi:hypothetical protein
MQEILASQYFGGMGIIPPTLIQVLRGIFNLTAHSSRQNYAILQTRKLCINYKVYKIYPISDI